MFIVYWLWWEKPQRKQRWGNTGCENMHQYNTHNYRHHNCITLQEIKQETLQQLTECIIREWPESRNETPQEIRSYWTVRVDMAVIDRIILKGRWIIITKDLQKQMHNQLHNKNMGIKWMRLLKHLSIYWIGTNADIESHMKNCSTCPEFHKCSWRRN